MVLRVRVGPFWQTIEAEHVEYEAGRMFADRMLRGPFKKWFHRHLVEPVDSSSCVLSDEIEYELPLGVLGRTFGGWFARRELKRLFEYRHEVTRQACEGDWLKDRNLEVDLGSASKLTEILTFWDGG